MRKAAITLVAANFLALTSPASLLGAPFDTASSIAHARRLIDANDHAAAAVMLEDALIDADAKERPTIVHLLRQSYAVIARRAEEAGRKGEAAHYRDNLAILNRDQESAARPGGADPKSKPPTPLKEPVSPEPPAARPATAAAPASVRPRIDDPARAGRDSTLPEKAGADRKGVTTASAEPATPAPTDHGAQAPLDPLPEPSPIPGPNANTPAAPQSGDPSPANRPDSVPTARGPAKAAPLRRQSPETLPSHSAAGRTLPALDSSPHSSIEKLSDPGAAAPLTDQKMVPAKVSVEEADRLYMARNYREAGKCYGQLARESRLPEKRKEHWAYCRYVALVEWVNKGPRSERDWAQILEELASIQRLAPKVWYGEYFRDLVAEVRRKGPRALPQSNDVVVRGSAPDDAEPKRIPRILGRLKGRKASQSEVAPQPSRPVEQPLELPIAAALPPAAVAESGPSRTGAAAAPADNEAPTRPLEPLDVEANRAGLEPSPEASSTWQIHPTANFRIFHHDARLAASAGEIAESVRAAQGKKWGSQAATKRWTPACEIYLYPDGKALAAATQQPESSPGFSTMTSDGSQVVARRVNLRADHAQLLASILPHEVTHVVLADLFSTSQIPRWADEGVAVLAEPRSEQQLRWSELQEPLETGRLFALNHLMGMDYPDPKDWSLYYAQSVSLTRFLVEQDSPERFIRFVLDAHEKGTEAALQDCYNIKGFVELQERWTAFARQQAANLTARARGTSDRSSPATSRSGGPVEGAQERQPGEGQR